MGKSFLEWAKVNQLHGLVALVENVALLVPSTESYSQQPKAIHAWTPYFQLKPFNFIEIQKSQTNTDQCLLSENLKGLKL